MGNFYSRHYDTPDLSNIYGLAKKTGRDEGYNNFMGDIVKMRVQAQIKAQQEAAKAQADKVAAAAEESSKPESESFWDKLDQFGLDIVDKQEKALSWTMDKLSRPLYGVTNAFQEMGHQAYQGEKDDIGKVANEFWKGFTGKKKQDMIQMIEHEATHTPKHGDDIWKNKAVQVGVGLVGDVFMDPTTYLGAGLVTKPIKAAQLMKGESKLSAIADDVEKLGVTRKLSDEEVAVSKGHHGPFTKEDYEQRVPLERSEILAMLGKAPKGRRATTGKAQQAMNARLMTEQLPRLKKLIREDPNLPTDESIARLTDEIDKIQKQRLKDLTEHGRQAYEQALADFERNPRLYDDLNLPPVGRTSALQDYEKTRNLSQTAHAFREEFFFRKGSKTNKSFHDVMGRGWKEDARISPEFREAAYDQTVKLAKNDKTHQKYMRSVAITLNEIRDLKAGIAAAKETGNTEKVAELEATLKSVTKKKDFYVDKANMEKAAIFHTLVRRHLGSLDGMSPELADEMEQLLAESDELLRESRNLVPENRLEVGSDNAGTMTPSTLGPGNTPLTDVQVRTSSDVDGESIVFDRNREINQRLAEIDSRVKQIQDTENFIGKESLEKPASLGDDFEVTEKWLKSKPKNPEEAAFQSDVRKELNERAEKEEDTLTESALRKKRETDLDKVVDKRIRSMFGNKDIHKGNELSATIEDRYKHPKVTIDGKDVYQADKDVLAKHVTDEDIREAARKSADVKGNNEEVYQVLNEINDIKASLRTGIDNASKDIDVLEGQSLERKLTEANERLRQLTHTSKTTVSPEHVAFDRLFKSQYGMTRRAAMVSRKTAIKDVAKATPGISKTRPTLSAADKAAIRAEAKERALKGVNEELKRGDFKVRKGQDLEFEVWDEDGFNRAVQAAVDQAKHDYAMKVAEAKAELHGSELSSRINALRQERDLKLELHQEALKEAKAAREAMADRLDEQLILDALNDSVMPMGQKRLQITFAGKSIVGPGIASPKILTAATEKLGGLPILQRANKVWSDAFKPASKIEPELNLARLRAQANTPLIIKHHVDDIRHRFARFKPEERRAALKGLKRGAPVGNRELYDGMREYLDELVPYLTGKVDIDGKPLELMEINKYLDEKYRFVGKDSRYTGNLDLSSPEKILKAMRRLPDNADPMQVMWNVRVATEQALAEKNMRNVIAKTYGVKREVLVGKQAKMAGRSEEGKLVESLRDEHGWTTVNDLGEDYLFAPETAAEIRKLMGMMKPDQTKEIVKRYDKVIRAWKTAVTVYNPGYYVRNGIGEYMMGMFDGLTDPRWYQKSAKVLSFAKPDHMEEVLKSLEPWKKHQTIAQKGAQTAVKMRRAKDLTYEDVWVLYHDTGLKSGFISSEFDHYFPSMGSAKATGVGQKLTGANDKLRNAGEHYEDFFRISHFMYRLAKSGHKDIMKAAEEAATVVRKYHFDYTDFTPFEKTAMIRLFPFYKWTRKSLPLMTSMLFTQPGKVMLYPKTMQAISYGSGGTDIASDDNGFAPNFEEVTPKWMRGMMAYPIGRDNADAMTYMNVATPQMDIMKMLANPVGTTTGMLTPGLKVPLEQATGHPLDPEFSDMKFEGSYDRAQALARTTPFGSLMRNIITNNEPDQDSAVNERGRMDEKLLSFLTGLGFYENNEQRQQGEQFRINMGGKP